MLAMQVTLRHPLSDLPDHMANLCHEELVLFDYFRLVCAKDFALCFESAPWEALILQYTRTEPAIYHAALSISALTRSNYHPTVSWHAPLHSTESVSEFCLAQYNLAIRTLNSRLDSSAESIELAMIASILFVYIEGFHGYTALMEMHLHGGLALSESLRPSSGHLASALWQLQQQVHHMKQIDSL